MHLNLTQIQIFKRKWWLTKGQVMCLATVVYTEKKKPVIYWMNEQGYWMLYIKPAEQLALLCRGDYYYLCFTKSQWARGLTELLICFKCLMCIITSLISTGAIWVRFYYSHFTQAQSLSSLSRTQIITDGTWFKSEQLKRLAVVLEGVSAGQHQRCQL